LEVVKGGKGERVFYSGEKKKNSYFVSCPRWGGTGGGDKLFREGGIGEGKAGAKGGESTKTFLEKKSNRDGGPPGKKKKLLKNTIPRFQGTG